MGGSQSTISGCTVRIELTTGITGGDVHQGQVTSARYLDVIRGLNEMGSQDGPSRNEAGSVSRLANKWRSARWRRAGERRPTLVHHETTIS